MSEYCKGARSTQGANKVYFYQNMSTEKFNFTFLMLTFFLAKTMFPKLSGLQAFILVYHNLKSSTVSLPTELEEALKSITLPDISNVKLPILQKTKPVKERLLLDSYKCFTSADILNGIPDLINIIKILYQKTIEAYCFEKIHWSNQMRKSAGIILFKFIKKFNPTYIKLYKCCISLKVLNV